MALDDVLPYVSGDWATPSNCRVLQVELAAIQLSTIPPFNMLSAPGSVVGFVKRSRAVAPSTVTWLLAREVVQVPGQSSRSSPPNTVVVPV